MEPTLFDLPPTWNLEADYVPKLVSYETANRWLEQYHYLGGAPSQAGAVWCVSLFAGVDAIATVVVGHPANASGVAGRLGLEAWRGNMEVTRVAVHPDAPKNTASRAVAAALKFVAGRSPLEWVFSYADSGQGHHGGIYQALNAVYCGMTRPDTMYLIDGKLTHGRTLVSRYGSRGAVMLDRLRAGGMTVEKVTDSAKHTFVLPIGTPAVRRAIRSALAPYQQPYPKRLDVTTEAVA